MTLPVQKPAAGSTGWHPAVWTLIDVVNAIDERIRDVLGGALIGGAGIDAVVNDAGDTITINNTSLGDAEATVDIVAAALTAGTGIAKTYDDTAGTITLEVTGGTTADAELIRDTMATALTAGAGITVTPNDGADIITIASTITQYTDALARTAQRRVVALTDAATITPDADSTDIGKVTLGGNRTLAAPAGTPVAGQKLILRLKQDATGSRTVTWNSVYRFAGGTTPTLTTTASKTDYFGFVYNADDSKWDCLAQKLNF
jgi:hypothetical protein